ncbi:hypothetical protein [Vibrio thalassae]|nr:hypothetical protein [Vibrio thalassae]
MGYYHFFASSTPTPETNIPNEPSTDVNVIEATDSSVDLGPKNTNRITSVNTDATLTKEVIAQPEVLQRTDANGNIVNAIVVPPPAPRGIKRNLTLTEEDREIIQLLRSKLLTKLRNENKVLQNESKVLNAPATVPAALPQQVIHAAPPPMIPTSSADFTEFETVQPALLSAGLSDAQIEEAFDRIKVASIIVQDNKPRAHVRIDNELVRAIEGKRIGDFRIEEVKAESVKITYIKGNVVRIIGHTGFSISEESGQ